MINGNAPVATIDGITITLNDAMRGIARKYADETITLGVFLTAMEKVTLMATRKGVSNAHS